MLDTTRNTFEKLVDCTNHVTNFDLTIEGNTIMIRRTDLDVGELGIVARTIIHFSKDSEVKVTMFLANDQLLCRTISRPVDENTETDILSIVRFFMMSSYSG